VASLSPVAVSDVAIGPLLMLFNFVAYFVQNRNGTKVTAVPLTSPKDGDRRKALKLTFIAIAVLLTSPVFAQTKHPDPSLKDKERRYRE
jgi:hypothetical protein